MIIKEGDFVRIRGPSFSIEKEYQVHQDDDGLFLWDDDDFPVSMNDLLIEGRDDNMKDNT